MLVVRSLPILIIGVMACGSDEPAAPECELGAVEACGGADEDCDGLTDEAGAAGCTPFLRDDDGDGAGDPDDSRCLCRAVPPYTAAPTALCGGVSCDDQNPCTTDACDPVTTACSHSPREGTCDDDDPCTADTVCDAGRCIGGTPVVCEDQNPCTIDTCVASFGCHYIPRTGVCDDGNRCTRNDQCTPDGCQGQEDPHCGEPWCGDGICNADETCDACPADCSPLGVGTCGATCDPAGLGASCPTGALCVGVAENGNDPDPESTHGVCVSQAEPCDPVGQSGCAADETCALLGGATGSAPFCVKRTGDLPVGGDCRADKASCGPGLTCFTGTCGIPCSPSDDRCPGGESCRDESDRLARDAGSWGRCQVDCGDGRCEDETCESCPNDCGPCEPACGDGFCLGTERCETCSQDCGLCPECGNGQCEPFEDCGRCPADCGACVCGDGRCSNGESCRDCPSDCTVCQCGDGGCDADEDCASCSEDCGACTCGDGQCNGIGEGCLSCSADCGECGACGDGICQAHEGCLSCPGDCGLCDGLCGDGLCVGAETRDTCPGDCRSVRCGNSLCEEDETCASCPADCRFQGMASCGPACDAVAPDCPANFVCFPSATGSTAMLKVLIAGEGICGAACERDDDCSGGACLGIYQAEVGKVCVPTDAAECEPTDPQACGWEAHCMPRTSDPTRGTCVRGCNARNPDACGGDPGLCHRGTGPRWRAGVCVGQETACNVWLQSGCAATQTCFPLSGWPSFGQAYVCSDNTGDAELDAPCQRGGARAETCRPGLLCGTDDRCHVPCDPRAPDTCGSRSCVDLAERLWIDPNRVGVCQ